MLTMKVGVEENPNIMCHGHSTDGESPCNSKNSGLSFTATYQPQPGELFFTRLLPFTEITQSCNFHAFIPLTSDYRALGLSLYTECPLLALGQLIIPEMAHTITFIGSENPTRFTSNFLGVTDPALVIESDLRVNNQLLLGNMIELQANPNGPDVVTVFGRGGSSGLVSRFSSVQVTIFGGVFGSEAVIRNDQLRVSTSSGRVFGFPAEMTITAPSNETNWHDLTLTVEGSLISDSQDSFTGKLTAEVVNKLTQFAEAGHLKERVARLSLERSKERLTAVNEAIKRNTLSTYNDTVEAAKTKLIEIKQEIERSELHDLAAMLDGLCTEQPCESTGELCGSCTSPQHLMHCPTGTKQTPVRSFFMSRITCRFQVESILEINQPYHDYDCPTSDRDSCRASTSDHTDIVSNQWRLTEVNVQSTKNCSVEGFNSVPDTCCENVSCAVFTPSPTCTLSNTICRSVRQSAVESLEGVTTERKELLQQLIDAQSDLVSANTTASRARLESELYLQKRDLLNASLTMLRNEHDTAVKYYNRTIEEVAPSLRIYESGKRNDFQNVLQINNVTFSTQLTDDPTSLLLNINFQTHIGVNAEQYREEYIYISTQSEGINFERIASDMVKDAIAGIE